MPMLSPTSDFGADAGRLRDVVRQVFDVDTMRVVGLLQMPNLLSLARQRSAFLREERSRTPAQQTTTRNSRFSAKNTHEHMQA